MQTISVTKARQNLYKLLEEAIRSSEPIQITSKKGNVVLLSMDDWNAVQETLYLCSIPGMRESIVAGMNASEKDLLDEKEIW